MNTAPENPEILAKLENVREVELKHLDTSKNISKKIYSAAYAVYLEVHESFQATSCIVLHYYHNKTVDQFIKKMYKVKFPKVWTFSTSSCKSRKNVQQIFSGICSSQAVELLF